MTTADVVAYSSLLGALCVLLWFALDWFTLKKQKPERKPCFALKVFRDEETYVVVVTHNGGEYTRECCSFDECVTYIGWELQISGGEK